MHAESRYRTDMHAGFYPVGDSGLVLVDMSDVVLGPFAFLVLLAVALSALASTQSTMVPCSRAVLSMARRGALPARLGLTHPRFKSPWVSLAMLGGIAATWYFLISSISENAMVDTLSSLGILVAFYYSITGIACVVYYRKHVVSSFKGFLMVGVGPTVGSIGLALMLIFGIQSVADPKASATGTAWLGLAPPLTIAAIVMVLGLIALLWRSLRSPGFFTSAREVADLAHGPFPIGRDVPIAPRGILIDCNESIEHLRTLIDAHRTFTEVERMLKRLDTKRIHRLFEESNAPASVAARVELAQPSTVLSRHPHTLH